MDADCNGPGEGFEPMIADSSDPQEVAQVILNAANSSSPDMRYAVGKDAESLLKGRTELSDRELSDRELEKWVRASYVEKKGFM